MILLNPLLMVITGTSSGIGFGYLQRFTVEQRILRPWH